MGLEDCDGECSGLDPIGCKLVSHEEIEQGFDESLKKLDRIIRDTERASKYLERRKSLRENHPFLYRVLNFF